MGRRNGLGSVGTSLIWAHREIKIQQLRPTRKRKSICFNPLTWRFLNPSSWDKTLISAIHHLPPSNKTYLSTLIQKANIIQFSAPLFFFFFFFSRPLETSCLFHHLSFIITSPRFPPHHHQHLAPSYHQKPSCLRLASKPQRRSRRSPDFVLGVRESSIPPSSLADPASRSYSSPEIVRSIRSVLWFIN